MHVYWIAIVLISMIYLKIWNWSDQLEHSLVQELNLNLRIQNKIDGTFIDDFIISLDDFITSLFKVEWIVWLIELWHYEVIDKSQQMMCPVILFTKNDYYTLQYNFLYMHICPAPVTVS